MEHLLTINAGSSSLKCALYLLNGHTPERICRFMAGDLLHTPTLTLKHASGEIESLSHSLTQRPLRERHQGALEVLLAHFDDLHLGVIGHRVVHGGQTFSQPVVVNEKVIEQLNQLVPLAPLHQPFNIQLLELCGRLVPDATQVACFDTAFHAQQPELERLYAIPRQLRDEGVQKYGFHGLSYQYILHQLDQLGVSDLNTIVCHLGAGASMCAIKRGRSIASSMGFSALEGLTMGSRCGNIDPGVLLYLMREHQMDVSQMEQLLYKESGWLGLSGISSEMLTLHESDQPQAQLTVDHFCYRAALEIGRLSAALQGVEQIVFTAGVGEHDSQVREQILTRCEWLGVKVQPQANARSAPVISTADSRIMVRIIATNEEQMIAQNALECLPDKL